MTPEVDRSRRVKIGVFFKHPVPGRVKTRLVPHLSPERAAALYEAFLLDTIDNCRSIDGAETVLFDGSPSESPWNRLPPDLPVVPQEGADLGARMTRALEFLLNRGARKALLVGSDSPSLPAEFLRDAILRLDGADVVLGPVDDGGYYLVGVTSPPGALLESIAWSTSSVLRDTVDRARRLHLSVDLTLPWFDVDKFDDLERLREDLTGSDRAPCTRAALGNLSRMSPP